MGGILRNFRFMDCQEQFFFHLLFGLFHLPRLLDVLLFISVIEGDGLWVGILLKKQEFHSGLSILPFFFRIHRGVSFGRHHFAWIRDMSWSKKTEENEGEKDKEEK